MTTDPNIRNAVVAHACAVAVERVTTAGDYAQRVHDQACAARVVVAHWTREMKRALARWPD